MCTHTHTQVCAEAENYINFACVSLLVYFALTPRCQFPVLLSVEDQRQIPYSWWRKVLHRGSKSAMIAMLFPS